MYKYKTIVEQRAADFKVAVDNAIAMGWEPFIPPTVNSESNTWMIILRRAR